MEQPRRKPNRLPDYNYAECGGYFLTICTRNREKLFWDDAGQLSRTGRIVDAKICEIPLRYPSIRLDHYVVMPNHVHLLLVIMESGAASISNVVCQMKGAATKEIGYSVWQKLYHDRVIRNDAEYLKIWNYIDTNPMKWELDCFYCE